MEYFPDLEQKEEDFSKEEAVENAQKCLGAILSGKEEEARVLEGKVEKTATYFGIQIPDLEEKSKWKEVSLEIIKRQLEIQNDKRSFDSISLRSLLIEEHGRMFFTGQRIEIGVIDREGCLEKDERLAELMERLVTEAKDFVVSSDEFRVLAVVNEGSISIRMDPGKHKEFLAVMLPNVLVYEHTPSSYEADERNSSSRSDYIVGVLEGGKKNKRGNVSSKEVVSDQDVLQDKFAEYFRLCHSVKNLDMVLKESDVSFAVGMFKKGAVNMERFLSASALCEKIKTKRGFNELEKRETGINYKEKLLLKKYLEESILPREHIRKKLEVLKSAKDLNYEIIHDLIGLDNKAKEILTISEGSAKTADEFVATYEKVASKLENMFGLTVRFLDVRADSSIGYVNIGSFLADMRKKVEPIANVARFGYGSSSVNRHQDGSVDVSEQGKKFLPEVAREAYDKFAQILDDKGGELKSWEDVKSLEEAVRFLHGLLIASTTAEQFLSNIKGVFKGRGNDAFLPVNVLDLSSNGATETEAGRILTQSTIGKRGFQLKRAFNAEQSGYGVGFPAAIISDEYFELNVPTNKHYVELCSQVYEGEEKEYTISLRYVESQYEGAKQRQEFVSTVLANNGFNINVNKERTKILNASIKTEDKDKWSVTLQKVLNLIVAMKDLDMGGIRMDTVDWFEKGVVHFWSEFRLLKETIDDGGIGVGNEEAKKIAPLIIGLGSESEKILLVKMIIDNMRSFKEDVAPYLEEMSENKLDEFGYYLLELEMQAKKEGNKKQASRLRRIGDHISAMQTKMWKESETPRGV